jgi:hypothetical protein
MRRVELILSLETGRRRPAVMRSYTAITVDYSLVVEREGRRRPRRLRRVAISSWWQKKATELHLLSRGPRSCGEQYCTANCGASVSYLGRLTSLSRRVILAAKKFSHHYLKYIRPERMPAFQNRTESPVPSWPGTRRRRALARFVLLKENSGIPETGVRIARRMSGA